LRRPSRRFAFAVPGLAAAALLALTACSDDKDGTLAGDAAPHGDAVADVADAAEPSADAEPLPDGALADTTTPPDTTAPSDSTAPPDTLAPGDTTAPTFCTPGERVCDSLLAYRTCATDGTGYGDPVACAEDENCREGACVVRCPNDPKFGSYVGCEFWATDLPNYPDHTLNPTPENLPWAFVVSNPGQFDVRVYFEMPPLFTYAPADDIVPGGESRVFQLPNINVQGTSVRPKGVHLTATGPVLAHTFNPWDNTFSNDASLLLPDPLLGDEYVIMTQPSGATEIEIIPGFTFPNQNGYFTVIAAYDNTDVTFQVTGKVRASGAIPKLEPGQLHMVRLNRGDVLNVQSDPEALGDPADLTGSRVTATKPIAVFAGHEEAVIGDPVPNGEGGTDTPCCADHLEDQMLPLGVLDTRYLAVKSPPRGTGQVEVDHWRIVAAEAGVTVTTNPPQAGANGVTLANIGSWVEVKTNQSFEVTATGKVQVGQYLVSRDATEQFTGDPSLVLMVPTTRFRKDYLVSLPESYTRLYLTLVKPNGASVTVDGQPVTQTFTPLGATGYGYAWVQTTAGVHVVSGSDKFGLTVYGYSNAVSFSVIGGLAMPGE